MERKLVDARVDLESAAHFQQIVEAPYPKIKPTLGKCQKISEAMFLAFLFHFLGNYGDNVGGKIEEEFGDEIRGELLV